MKRLIMLAVLCAFVLSAAAASAADIKASGAFVTDAIWQRNWDFAKGNDSIDGGSTRTFDVTSRADLTFEFIASENLKGVFNVRTQEYWGRDGYEVGGTDSNLQIRKAYLDFNWPGTAVNVKVGHQGIALPNAVGGSYILDSRMGALIVSAPVTDNVALTGGYLRAISDDDTGLANVDFYTLIADMNFGDISVTPFIVYGNVGDQNANLPVGMSNTANTTQPEVDGAYWLGVSTSMAFGDITVAGDLDYGNVSGEDDKDDRSGWYFAVSAEYAGLDMMTPEVYFLYNTGEDDDASNGSERMPTIDPDWGIGSFFFGGDAWLNGSINEMDNTLGFWALGVSLKDIASFADGLTHTAHLIYAKGTNDKDASGLEYGESLTEEDSLWELDFNTYYKLYDELTIGLELGYLHLDADEDVWGADGGSAYKIGTGIAYKF